MNINVHLSTQRSWIILVTERMMRSLTIFSAILSLWTVLPYSSKADGPLDGEKQLVVREVCKFTDREGHCYFNGSLTYDGKDLIVVQPHKKLSLYSVETLTERVISENPSIVYARSDAATGGIFVNMDSEKIGSKDEGKRTLKFFDLLYFANTNDLLTWKPKWTKKRIVINSEKDGKELHTLWIPGVEQFALFRNGSSSNEFTFIDLDGNDVGALKLPGRLLPGFDTSEEGVEVYYLQGTYLMRGVLNSKQDKLLRSVRVNPSPFRGFGSISNVDRHLRFRGLRPGDVRKLLELGAEPKFSQHKDHEDLGLESALLDSLKLSTLKNGGRIGELGLLSYAESPSGYEIVLPRENSRIPGTFIPPFVCRRSGDLVMLPMYRVVDAVLSDETWVVSMTDQNHLNRRDIECKFFVATLDNPK